MKTINHLWAPVAAHPLLARTLQLVLTPTTSRAQSPVDIDVKEFGVGNAWRPGDTIGVRIELTSNERDEASYWVEWQLQTADGDLAGHGRRIALSLLCSAV